MRLKFKENHNFKVNQVIKINGVEWMIYCVFKHKKKPIYGCDLYKIDEVKK